MALTYSQSDLDALKEALLTGASEVRIGERTMKFRSQKELLDLIEMVQTSIEGSTDDDPSIVQATYSRGSS